MTVEANRDLVVRTFAALSAGDMPGFFDCFADDVQWTIIGQPIYSGTYVGKDDLASRLFGRLGEQLDENGIRGEVQNTIAEGNTVVAQVQGTAQTKTGRSYNNTYCFVIEVHDGRIKKWTEYLDTELVTAAFVD